MAPLQAQSALPENTRDRLLVAACEVFAELGFRGATVREICRRAEVNVAAVNYHFNGKEALFLAALQLEPIGNLIAASSEPGSAEVRLARLIQNFMTRLMGGCCTPHSRLIMRELLEPSPALDIIAKEIVAPLHEHLASLVREIAGDGTAPEQVRRCVFSIVGQCSYYRNTREMNRSLYPELNYDEQEIEATARHIAEFSLAGMKRMAGN
jgi:AcrR family transcriptional regulator